MDFNNQKISLILKHLSLEKNYVKINKLKKEIKIENITFYNYWIKMIKYAMHY